MSLSSSLLSSSCPCSAARSAALRPFLSTKLTYMCSCTRAAHEAGGGWVSAGGAGGSYARPQVTLCQEKKVFGAGGAHKVSIQGGWHQCGNKTISVCLCRCNCSVHSAHTLTCDRLPMCLARLQARASHALLRWPKPSEVCLPNHPPTLTCPRSPLALLPSSSSLPLPDCPHPHLRQAANVLGQGL